MIGFESSVPESCGVRALCLIAFLFLLSACTEEPSVFMESDQNGGLATSFTPPDMLTQSRMVVQSALQLIIQVNGNPNNVAVNAGSNSGTLSIPAERGQLLSIVATWSELYEGQYLTLAEAKTDETVPIDEDATYSIVIDTDNYRTDFDDDGDGITNLDERNDETDPRVPDVPTDPIVEVPINLRAATPEQLTNISSDINETLSAVAAIDSATTVQLNRQENTWIGETAKPANSDMLVNYSFYSSIRPNVVLATWEGRRNAGGAGTTVDISSSEYDYEKDKDGDGISNVDEVIQGTNPEDKNDPALNPCDISNFEPGCKTDTDGDGKPDSEETQIEDRDGDLIPDYQESTKDDADKDGSNAESDPDESDPCKPDKEAIACDNSGPNEPPVIEPPEASPLSYDLFEGEFGSVPDFSRLTSTQSGAATTFSLPSGNDEEFYALRFAGKLFVEQAGEYTFYTESDDGSRLIINDTLVVDNDGTHSVLEESGVIALSAGLHDIVLEYFQNGGLEALTVSWSSSDIAKQAIPEDVLFAP